MATGTLITDVSMSLFKVRRSHLRQSVTDGHDLRANVVYNRPRSNNAATDTLDLLKRCSFMERCIRNRTTPILIFMCPATMSTTYLSLSLFSSVMSLCNCVGCVNILCVKRENEQCANAHFHVSIPSFRCHANMQGTDLSPPLSASTYDIFV